jgi:hypothetical protein
VVALLHKQITLDQRGELFELAHFTNGGGGRPRRPSSENQMIKYDG